MRVLVVHDSSSFAFILQRYFPGEVSAIYFSEHSVISQVKNPKFFVTGGGLYAQVEQIRNLSKDYDVFLCFGWLAASICYLAEVKYVMYFVDSYIDPEYRIRKNVPFFKKMLLDNLYKDSLEAASAIVAALPYDVKILKKYRPDTKTISHLIDSDMFNSNVKKIEIEKDKFVFFSPQRIDPGKGHDTLWEALQLTKSDFVVLQTDWGTGKYYEKIIHTKPPMVKLIPKIKREYMPSYFVSADAILGQVSPTSCGSIEREGALCNKPVFCHAPESFSENDPFYKENRNPKDIAAYIDRIVTDKEFREKLATAQNVWVKKTFDNNKTVQLWMKVFEEMIHKSASRVKMKYKIVFKLLSIIEDLIHKDLSSVGRNIT